MRNSTKIRPLCILLSGLIVAGGLLTSAATNASATVPTPPAPTCVTTAVAGLPVAPPHAPTPQPGPFATLTATDSLGLWAGVRYDGYWGFQVVAWRDGVSRVLDNFSYSTGSFNLESVHVVGINPARGIIVNAQIPGTNRSEIFRYQTGRRLSYAHNPSWTSWSAGGASPDGHLAGLVQTPKGKLVVSWSPTGAATTIAAGDVSQVRIDQYNDVIWAQTVGDTSENRFRTPSGRIGRLLPGSSDQPNVWAAAGQWAWGLAGMANTPVLVTWKMSMAEHSSALSPIQLRVQSYGYVVAGGTDRTYIASKIFPTADQYALYDAYGDGHRLPSNLGEFAITKHGAVAYTSTNGHAYFVNCPLNYAKHNPRGLIYHAAVSTGQTIITGGAFDSDDPASHIGVDIYDETGGVRKKLSRVWAYGYDPSFSSAYGISGNHRYRYVFPSVAGKHTYCAYGMNIGYGNANHKLGCTTVTT